MLSCYLMERKKKEICFRIQYDVKLRKCVLYETKLLFIICKTTRTNFVGG